MYRFGQPDMIQHEAFCLKPGTPKNFGRLVFFRELHAPTRGILCSLVSGTLCPSPESTINPTHLPKADLVIFRFPLLGHHFSSWPPIDDFSLLGALGH